MRGLFSVPLNHFRHGKRSLSQAGLQPWTPPVAKGEGIDYFINNICRARLVTLLSLRW